MNRTKYFNLGEFNRFRFTTDIRSVPKVYIFSSVLP